MDDEHQKFPVSLILDLAKISKAVYPGPVNQKNLLISGSRFGTQNFIHGSYGRGFCRVFTNDHSVAIAFRGTRESIDWTISNLRAWPVHLTDCSDQVTGISVHRGFQSALGYTDKTTGKQSLQAIFSCLEAIDIKSRNLYITGHSLGGSIATLFAAKLANNMPKLVEQNLQAIVTFGAPAVGGDAFKTFYGPISPKTLRVINRFDGRRTGQFLVTLT